MKQRFTGTQYANLFTITSTTVVQDGLGTNQKLGARSVSICCCKTLYLLFWTSEIRRETIFLTIHTRGSRFVIWRSQRNTKSIFRGVGLQKATKRPTIYDAPAENREQYQFSFTYLFSCPKPLTSELNKFHQWNLVRRVKIFMF